MKKFLPFLFCFLPLTAGFPAFAQSGPPPDPYGENSGYPPRVERNLEDASGWFIGSDQGVLFFVGTGEDFIGPQYYGSVYGGYNFGGWIAPLLRIGQALGSARGFFSPSTFFFIMEGGVKVTPLRTKFRPYLVGTAGFYVLDYSDFGFPVQNDVNFTFATGGGVEYKFGSSVLGVGSAYRGFLNDGLDLRGVEVTLGYSFQF